MIEVIKESEGKWLVWNTKNHKCADIVKINEHNALFKVKTKYRVDVNGVTVDSMIGNFQTAKGIAIKNIKK